MLNQIISQCGIEKIDQAQNGFDGYQLVLNNQYDFILCDLEMPVMNGYECAKKIKQHYEQDQSFFNVEEEKCESFCPLLVACSALITPLIERKAMENGFDLCVQSPINSQFIQEKII
jgi:CheY-like chemotaxis protein